MTKILMDSNEMYCKNWAYLTDKMMINYTLNYTEIGSMTFTAQDKLTLNKKEGLGPWIDWFKLKIDCKIGSLALNKEDLTWKA